MLKQLKQDGWRLDRTRGDHRQYIHPVKPGTVTVPGHEGDDLAPGYAKLDSEASGVETMKYAVVLEKAPGNCCAYVPDLPGCVTTGPTLEDTRRLIAEAIDFHIEGMRLRGERIPEPITVVDSIETAA
jgi:predicted RNase H-like HicB family nuclease/predicted RNA binding protein YcfA (HicA-like mRNA interferase family)